MKLLLILLVWLAIAAVLTAGILMAVLGKGVWLLILAVVGFVLLFGKYGCLESH